MNTSHIHIKYIVIYCIVSILPSISSSCASLEAIPSIVDLAWYQKNATYLDSQGVIEKDRQALASGNLIDVLYDYETILCTGQRLPHIDVGCDGRSDYQNLTELQLKLLCDIYTRLLDKDNALACLAQVKANYIGSNEQQLQMHNGKRALVFLRAGDYRKAEHISRSISSDSGQYINALAKVYLGHINDALKLADKLRVSHRERQVYMAVNLFAAAGDFSKALALAQDCYRQLSSRFGLVPHVEDCGYDRVVDTFEFDLFGDLHIGTLGFISYAPKANIYVEFLIAKALLEVALQTASESSARPTTGELAKAKSRFDLILNHKHITTYRDIHWMSLGERGRIALLEGDQAGAKDYFERAIAVIEEVRDLGNATAGLMGYVADKRGPYTQVISMYAQQQDGSLALEYAERAKNRELQNLYYQANSLAVVRREDRGKVRSLKRQEQLLASNELQSKPVLRNVKKNTFQDDRADVIREYRELRCVLKTCNPKFDSIRNRTEENEAIFYYFFDEDDGLKVFVVTQQMDKAEIVDTGLKEKTLSNEIICFRKLLEDDKQSISNNEKIKCWDFEREDYAQSLFENLIVKAENSLDKHYNITIVPTGILHYLPFAALMDDDKYMVEEYNFSVVPSLTLRTELPKIYTSKNEDYLLVVGNPKVRGLENLESAKEEASTIAYKWEKKYPHRTKLLVEEDARVEEFLKVIANYNYIHFATHAQFDGGHPENSKLLFTPDKNGDFRTGEIKVKNLMMKDIPLSSELVVLSGCETAIAGYQNDVVNGLVGLAIGFRKAGANQVIASLWKVKDKPTAKLMNWLYQYLLENDSPANALRKAQALMSHDAEYKDPSNWAAFQHMY